VYVLLGLLLCLITVAIGGQDRNFLNYDALSPPSARLSPLYPHGFPSPLTTRSQPLEFPQIEEPSETYSRPRIEAQSAPPTVMPSPPAGSMSEKFLPLIRRHAQQYGLEEKLVQAVIYHESGFDPRAVSPEGAKGLMQLMPETAARLGVRNALDPQQNIAGGVKYLKMCLDQFDQDPVLALAAYNAGPDNVEKYRGCPPFRETRRFVAAVMQKCYGPDWRKHSGKKLLVARRTQAKPGQAGEHRKLPAPPKATRMDELTHLRLVPPGEMRRLSLPAGSRLALPPPPALIRGKSGLCLKLTRPPDYAWDYAVVLNGKGPNPQAF